MRTTTQDNTDFDLAQIFIPVEKTNITYYP